jgi:hypothetical protein
MEKENPASSVRKAIAHHVGEASIVEVARDIWDNYESELRSSGDLFYTWQYDMRWDAQQLRDRGEVVLGRRGGRNTWRRV